MIDQKFVLLGVFLQSLGGLSYLLETISGKIQPNKVTWLLWSIAPIIAFSAELSKGVGIQSLTTFIVGFVPLVIFISSFINKKASWKLGRLDIICGALSSVGLILWWITKEGNIAILLAILADGLAAVPTIIKSYFYPETESDLVFWLAVVNAGIGLLVIKEWNFPYYAFPTYLLVVNITLAVLIRFKVGGSRIPPSPHPTTLA